LPAMRFFSAAPGENFGALVAGIWMVAPVCGLRPVRAPRSVTSKEPKPVNITCLASSRARGEHIEDARAATDAAGSSLRTRGHGSMPGTYNASYDRRNKSLQPFKIAKNFLHFTTIGRKMALCSHRTQPRLGEQGLEMTMKIEITIAARGCLDYDTEIDAETNAYLDAYAEAVAEAVADAYQASVECGVCWRAPATAISIDGDLDINALEAAEETVRAIARYLWDNPDKWWRRNSEFHPNA